MLNLHPESYNISIFLTKLLMLQGVIIIENNSDKNENDRNLHEISEVKHVDTSN